MNRKKPTRRREIKSMMAQIFCDKIQGLPREMQDILLDDLVTAFESRFEVLNKHTTVEIKPNIGMDIYAPIKA